MSHPRSKGNRESRTVTPGYASDEFEGDWIRDLTPSERTELKRRGRIKAAPKNARDREYEEEFAQWVEGLSEEDRFQAMLGGVDKAALDTRTVDKDQARRVRETALPSVVDRAKSGEDDPAQALQRKDPRTADEQAAAKERMSLEAVCLVLPAIIDAEDSRLEASLIALAVDIAALQGITIEGLSAKHGVTMTDVAFRARAWQREIGICRLSVEWVKFVLGFILEAKNPKLAADIICSAASIKLRQGLSWRKQSGHHGLCVAAWSQRVRRWVNRMGLPLPADCKQKTDAYGTHNPRQLPRLV